MFQQSNSFLVHQVGVEKKQVLQHMDSAASLASSASEQAQVESLKRDWYDDVESIRFRWKRKYDALRWHNRMPHWYFLSKSSFSNLQKWRSLFIVCIPNDKMSSSTLHVSKICRELSNKKNNNKNTHCWIHQETVQWHSTKSSIVFFVSQAHVSRVHQMLSQGHGFLLDRWTAAVDMVNCS